MSSSFYFAQANSLRLPRMPAAVVHFLNIIVSCVLSDAILNSSGNLQKRS